MTLSNGFVCLKKTANRLFETFDEKAGLISLSALMSALISRLPFKIFTKFDSPDISRVGGFHRQGIQGCSCTLVLQTLDNAAYGSLRLARRVNIF
jgi:hypothetical protein